MHIEINMGQSEVLDNAFEYFFESIEGNFISKQKSG